MCDSTLYAPYEQSLVAQQVQHFSLSLSSAFISVRPFKWNSVLDRSQTGDIVRPELLNSLQNMSLPCTMQLFSQMTWLNCNASSEQIDRLKWSALWNRPQDLRVSGDCSKTVYRLTITRSRRRWEHKKKDVQYIRFPPVTKNKAELITASNWLVYFPEASLFHNKIPKHIDVFVTSHHKLKKKIVAV
jgi:hypothetical protein